MISIVANFSELGLHTHIDHTYNQGQHELWVATIFSSLDFLFSSVSMANLSHLVAATLLFFLLVSMANLRCLLSSTFSSLRFLSNSFSSPHFNLLRVATRHCFLSFYVFLFSCLILSLSFLYSSVSEALLALSFLFLSECYFSLAYGRNE